jgi:hypothetical protein
MLALVSKDDVHSGSAFFRLARAMWVVANIGILIVSVSGYRDLTGITLMLSFPADILALTLALIGLAGVGIAERSWVFTASFGVLAILCGYVQWFVLGRAIAARLLARLPATKPLRVVLRGAIVLLWLVQALIGWEVVRATEADERFWRRASAIRAGMTADEVRSILGEPREVSDNTGEPKPCHEPLAVRASFYWYEHERLPGRFARSSSVLRLCSDQRGVVIERSMIIVD